MTRELAVIFDMDGVLIDTYGAHLRSWQLAARPYGVSISEADFRPTFGRTSREAVPLLLGRDDVSERTIRQLDEAKEQIFRDLIAVQLPWMDGALSALERLHAAGFRLALGSSGPAANVQTMLAQLPHRERLEAVVHGNDVRVGKPDPEVFLLAAERLGVPAARCLVVEDSTAGIRAARAAGMVCAGLLSTGHEPSDVELADRVILSLDELTPQWVRELLADH